MTLFIVLAGNYTRLSWDFLVICRLRRTSFELGGNCLNLLGFFCRSEDLVDPKWASKWTIFRRCDHKSWLMLYRPIVIIGLIAIERN